MPDVFIVSELVGKLTKSILDDMSVADIPIYLGDTPIHGGRVVEDEDGRRLVLSADSQEGEGGF